MKKNLITVMVLALVLVNLVLTALLTITIVPQTKKANELITQVCSAINLELQSGSVTSDASAVPIDKLAPYSIVDSMTITEAEGYAEYGETLGERETLIKDTLNTVIGSYTYEEFKADTQGVRNTIVEELQKLFGSNFIVSVSFPTMTYQ